MAVIASVMIFTGCGGTDDSSAKAAKVNDTVITEDQLDCYTKISMQLMGYDPSDITEDQKEELLNQLVVIQVVKEHYKDKGDELYGDDYESAVKTFTDSAHESAADFLTQYEITDDQLEDFTAVSMLYLQCSVRYRRNMRQMICTALRRSIMKLIRMNLKMMMAVILNWMK